jgi:hypothetical protein
MSITRSFTFILASALLSCAIDDPVDDAVLPLEGEPAPVTMPSEKSDFFNSPELWRNFWYYSYYGKLSAPIENTTPSAPFTGTRTVLLIPGTTIGPEFFTPMAQRLRRDGFDPVIWAPRDLFTESLEVGAQRIADKVRSVLAERGITKLHLVAECDAGVAARYYAQSLGGHHELDELVTFVSAHHGTSAALLGAWFTSWQALRDIKPNSTFQARLNGVALPAGLRMTSIYSCRDEYMYPYTTSRVTGARNVELCGRAIGHFDGFWDGTVYTHIRETLRGNGASLPTYY